MSRSGLDFFRVPVGAFRISLPLAAYAPHGAKTFFAAPFGRASRFSVLAYTIRERLPPPAYDFMFSAISAMQRFLASSEPHAM